MIIAREENIPDDNIYEEERKIINDHISKSPKLKAYISTLNSQKIFLILLN